MSSYCNPTGNAYVDLALKKGDYAATQAKQEAYNPSYVTSNNSIFTTNQTTTPTNVNTVSDVPLDPECTDGADDGKLGFGETLGSFFKGVISPITSMFESPENFIKGAAMVVGGGLLIAATGGAAAPLLVAAGVTMGGIQIVKGAANAANAKTDAEAKAAWEEIGCGTGAVAGSVIGAKAAVKAAGIEGASEMSSLQATKACFTNAGSCAKNSLGAFTSGAWKTNLGIGKNSAKTEDTPETGEKTPTKEKDMTPEQKAEKIKTDAEKQKINAEKQRQQQYEYNKKAKAEYEAQKQADLEDAQAQSDVGKNAVESGDKSYAEQKAENIRNRSHDNKKVANEGAREARDAQLQENKIITKDNPKELSEINKELKHAEGKAKHADTQEAAIKAYEDADALATRAENIAKQAREYANKYPENKNLQIKAANQEAAAKQARAYADNAAKAGEARISELEIKPNTNESTNPFNKMVEDGVSPEGANKMETHAKQSAQSAIKRANNKIKSRPAYQRAYKQMQNYNKGELQHVINTSKNSGEIAAAKDLLNELGT